MATNNDINNYITLRFKNWLDFAKHLAKVNHFEGWENDLLNEAILSLLKQPENKLAEMLTRKTEMIINGAPTTEIDKFILKIIRVNACYPTAPFRKNILGLKIINRAAGKIQTQQTTELKGTDRAAENYDFEQDQKREVFHCENITRLTAAAFSISARETYIKHFIHSAPARELTAREKEQLKKVVAFLVSNKKTLFD